ncbi:MAG: hypothetical protein N2508_03960, partial [Anaerolineae bacterium]|nr:hypothetical protein [Anaerolineae bacterium]
MRWQKQPHNEQRFSRWPEAEGRRPVGWKRWLGRPAARPPTTRAGKPLPSSHRLPGQQATQGNDRSLFLASGLRPNASGFSTFPPRGLSDPGNRFPSSTPSLARPAGNSPTPVPALDARSAHILRPDAAPFGPPPARGSPRSLPELFRRTAALPPSLRPPFPPARAGETLSLLSRRSSAHLAVASRNPESSGRRKTLRPPV